MENLRSQDFGEDHFVFDTFEYHLKPMKGIKENNVGDVEGVN